MHIALLRSALLAVLLAWSVATPASPGLVVLVRHAEKADEAGDAGLSEAGKRRSEALAAALRELRLAGILVSSARRTQQTAAPVATRQRLEPEIIEVSGADLAAHVEAIARRVRERSLEAAVLVVGHSNTLPGILEALGGPRRPPLDHCEYDAMWLLRLGAERAFIEARYGQPSSNCAE